VRLQRPSALKPKLLIEEFKEDMSDGMGCKCAARSAVDCACDVDWTPKEVYELMERVKELEGLLSKDTSEWKSAAFQKIKGLEAENKRLREALQEIAKDRMYTGDRKRIARAALLTKEVSNGQ